jgi:hypothetical protein
MTAFTPDFATELVGSRSDNPVSDNPGRTRFLYGGAGALAPLMVSLVLVDIDVLSGYLANIDGGGIYRAAGYAVQFVVLFVIGGLWATMHRSERDPRKLFQLGLVAPAMITAMLNASNVQQAQEVSWLPDSFAIVSSAHAQSTEQVAPVVSKPTPLEQFLDGLLKRPR